MRHSTGDIHHTLVSVYALLLVIEVDGNWPKLEPTPFTKKATMLACDAHAPPCRGRAGASPGCVGELTSGLSSRQLVVLGTGPEMTKILLVASLPFACRTVTA